ncbi:TetR/AcrR family transcriptional regulator [Nonomuraea typhae]|uniref:TetR/AcrR family transcriptional regulator n=1 Tax=Nonomuraea typhae TaxID=2603600 RepID=UPI0012FA15A5|nr:TetR/AcrR family transcriptional regulator [Nonomuraea typhae]
MAELEALIAKGRKHGARKRVILLQAARLFVERGYDLTGIDDIGAAAGVSGPAVYKHFAGKQAILIALIELSIERLREGSRAVLESREREPEERLVMLVNWFAAFALENQELMLILQGELPRLPEEDRRRLVGRMREVREEWAALLAEARPGLSALGAQIAVTSVMGMVTPVIAARLGGETALVREHLRAQMLAVLRADRFREKG